MEQGLPALPGCQRCLPPALATSPCHQSLSPCHPAIDCLHAQAFLAFQMIVNGGYHRTRTRPPIVPSSSTPSSVPLACLACYSSPPALARKH